MKQIDIILKYFPKLTEDQKDKFERLGELYKEWNQQINVISRKDIENLYTHHILHSLAIAKWINFKPGAKIIDLGTGGGFPGIPLAILFPETNFKLVDSIGKKLKVVTAVAEALGLENVRTEHVRAEEQKEKFDFVITRAVAKLDKLLSWSNKLIREKQQHAMPNGLIALKGSNNAAEETKALRKGTYFEMERLSSYFKEPFFETKCLVYVQY